MHLNSLLRAGLCVLALTLIAPLQAEPLGSAFTYQGRLQQAGSPATGLYDFQFSLWDNPGGGTRLGATQTVSAVTVSNGLFSVALDFGSVFNGSALWLELSARSNGAGGFSALSPRQALTAAPHASYAANAGSAALANSVAAGSITSAALAPGAVSQLGSPNGAFPNALQVSTNGWIGVGTNSPNAALQISGGASLLVPVVSAEAVQGMGSINTLWQAYGLAASTNLLAVAAMGGNAVTLLDSSGHSLNYLSSVRQGQGSFTNLLGARSVAFGPDNLLAVAAPEANAVTLIDASQPYTPVWRAVLRQGMGSWSDLTAPTAVAFRGTVLAVAARTANAVTLIDVANPAAPAPIVIIKNGFTGFNALGGPSALIFQDRLLAIAAAESNAVTLADVSNIAIPYVVAVLNRDTGYANMKAPGALALDGPLLAVANYMSDTVYLVDVSVPSAPVKLAELRHNVGGVGPLASPCGLTFLRREGRLLLAVTARDSQALVLFDVTEPTRPVQRGAFVHRVQPGFNYLASPYGVVPTAEGQLAVAAYGSSAVTLLGLTNQQASLSSEGWVGIGTTAPKAALHVLGDVLVERANRVELQAQRVELGINTAAMLPGSTAMGENTTASGSGATAMGLNSIASGTTATAMGFNTTASGYAATAMGFNTLASGLVATAMGNNTRASGMSATALGDNTTAGGVAAFAAGSGARATNDYCFVWADNLYGSDFVSTGPNQFLVRARGGVGINTNDSAGAALHVAGSTLVSGSLSVATNLVVDAQNSNNGFLGLAALTFGAPSGEGIASKRTPGGNQYGLDFYTTYTPRMSIDNSGRVGIGTTTPNYTLQVNGTAYCSSGAWSGSDARWKQNIQPLESALAKVLALQGVSYEWRRDEFPDRGFESGLQLGFIAQEVEPILPEVVHTDAEGYKAIAYEKLTPVLTEAIKEQQRQLQAQQARLETLEAQNARLAATVAELKALVHSLTQTPQGAAQ